MEENYTTEEKNKLATIEEGAVAYPAGGYNRSLYEAVGAVYNDKSGYYELNGLIDITEKEMSSIYKSGRPKGFDLRGLYDKDIIRTNIAPLGQVGALFNNYCDIQVMFASCYQLEVANVSKLYTTKARAAFRKSIHLQTILGFISFEEGKISNDCTDNMFDECKSLKTINMRGLRTNIYFGDSPSLSKDSILYMIKYSAATFGITVILHPTAYTMAIDDSEIQTALKEKPLVSLASA